MSAALEFLRAMNDGLATLGWGVYQSDHEDANFQYEINFHYAEAETTADRLVFFRMMAGQIARRFGRDRDVHAQAVRRPDRLGRHMHYHLADAKTGANLFLDESDPPRSRPVAARLPLPRRGPGARPGAAAVTSPTVNCYKRLQVGAALTGSRSGYTWVPAFITYGDNNRTQMLRVPGPGHVEDRTVSAACNPYLAMAAYLAAGLDGIARQLDPGRAEPGQPLRDRAGRPMAERGLKILPQTLDAALDHFEADPVVRSGPRADRRRVPPASSGPNGSSITRQVGAWEIERYLTAL